MNWRETGASVNPKEVKFSVLEVYLHCLRLTEAGGGQKVLVERVSPARNAARQTATAPSSTSDSQMSDEKGIKLNQTGSL